LGLVPALGLDNDQIIVESAAIVAFLTEADCEHRLAPEPGTNASALYLSALAFMSSNIYSIMKVAELSVVLTSDLTVQKQIRSRAERDYHKTFDLINARLAANGPFLLGEQYSAADIYLFMLTIWAKPSEQVLLERCKSIARISGYVRTRPILKAALEVHGVSRVSELSK
jgi:glutathione S-transferase